MIKQKSMKKRKNNKGFSLVELIIVVAIMAILVGILAPQYVKYVERAKQSADASNLDALVSGVKIASADGAYQIPAGTYRLTIEKAGAKFEYISHGTSVAPSVPADAVAALKEYTGYDFASGAATDSNVATRTVEEIKIKSGKWDGNHIAATITVSDTGSISVDYEPENFITILSNQETSK